MHSHWLLLSCQCLLPMLPSHACYNFTHSTVAPPLPHPPPLTLDVPVHDAEGVQVLETIEHTQKDVLGIAEDKTRTFTVLLEVKEVVTQRRSLPLLQQALDVTCRDGFGIALQLH